MAHKQLKNSAMAAIVLGCALGVAQAAGLSAPPIDPAQLQTLHNLLKPKPGVPLPQTGGGRLTPGPPFAVGWNFRVCAKILFFHNEGNFSYVAINTDQSFLSANGGSNLVLFTFQRQVLAACQHSSRGYYVNITDPRTGAFNALDIVYP
jgi:hypothetical protein